MESVLPPTLTPFLTQVEIFCVYVLSTFCARSYKKAWLYAKNHTQDGKYICRLLPDSQIRARLEQVQHVVLEQALINILPTQTKHMLQSLFLTGDCCRLHDIQELHADFENLATWVCANEYVGYVNQLPPNLRHFDAKSVTFSGTTLPPNLEFLQLYETKNSLAHCTTLRTLLFQDQFDGSEMCKDMIPTSLTSLHANLTDLGGFANLVTFRSQFPIASDRLMSLPPHLTSLHVKKCKLNTLHINHLCNFLTELNVLDLVEDAFVGFACLKRLSFCNSFCHLRLFYSPARLPASLVYLKSRYAVPLKEACFPPNIQTLISLEVCANQLPASLTTLECKQQNIADLTRLTHLLQVKIDAKADYGFTQFLLQVSPTKHICVQYGQANSFPLRNCTIRDPLLLFPQHLALTYLTTLHGIDCSQLSKLQSLPASLVELLVVLKPCSNWVAIPAASGLKCLKVQTVCVNSLPTKFLSKCPILETIIDNALGPLWHNVAMPATLTSMTLFCCHKFYNLPRPPNLQTLTVPNTCSDHAANWTPFQLAVRSNTHVIFHYHL
jgi:hypothetical protein